jgi:hypothetical protein
MLRNTAPALAMEGVRWKPWRVDLVGTPGFEPEVATRLESSRNRPTFARPEEKKGQASRPNPLSFMVAGEGFEPSTFGL